jgi:phosphoglycerate dehydrogenase-like enzyme
MDVSVLVPHQQGLEAFASVPGVRVQTYDPSGELPTGAQVLVPPFLSGADGVALVERLPDVRLVQLLSAGAETWVGRLPDDVLLSDCRGAHGGATAEWVVAALLGVYRHLSRFALAQADGRWDYHQTEELAGKKVLVVGAGDIAEHLVRRLAPFEVETTLVARTARPPVHGIDEVRELLPHHDACVVVVPLTDQTRGLVDAGFLAAMPEGAVLVNAARGPVLDTDALLAELASGRLRAALDVTDPEPLPVGHPLWDVPGLLLTPHVGGSVPGGLRRAYAVAAEQVAFFARGEDPPNVVRNGY